MKAPRREAEAVGDSYAACGCAIDAVPPRSTLALLEAPRTAWTSPTTAIAAGGATETLTASGPGRFQAVREGAERLFGRLETSASVPAGARPRLFGGFSFTHSRDAGGGDDTWKGYPDARFVLPAVQVSVTADGTWLTTTARGPDAVRTAADRRARWRSRLAAVPSFEESRPPAVTETRRIPGPAAWREGVESAVDRIRRGDLQKVVLARALTAQLTGAPDVADVLARLGESSPSCLRFLFDPGDGGTFFGVTPERLVRLRERVVDTEALAGSAGRGETGAEDDRLAARLRDSEKNRHEHDLVVDAISGQLAGVAADIETGDRTVRKLPTVQHLQTPIRATLDRDRHVLELVERLHPTPAVGGLPPAAATRTIRASEAFERGWYAAPVGWIDEDGDGTFAVAIRSAVADGPTATLFAGAGIVSDSNPEEEWDETRLKFRPILDELA